MNICIVGQYPPQVGGIATYTRQLENALKQKGHNTYILTYKQNVERENNVFEAKTSSIPFLRGLIFIISSFFTLRNIVDKYDIDVIHANYLIPPALVSTFISKKNVKIVATAHGSDINILLENNLTRPLVKYTLKHLDNVYFVSKKLEEKALTLNIPHLKEKSAITPNTVDANKFRPMPHENKTLKNKYQQPIVIFIGNLVKQKGLKYLLKAKKLSKTKYTLLIYGDGPEKEMLNNYIKKENIPNTYLMGKTTTPEKIIPESDIMVLPSISEGSSIVALESMACAKALVSTNSGDISTVITNNENGIIVPIKDYNALQTAIDRLIEDENKRIELGKNARKLIKEKYSTMKIPYIN